MTARYVGGAQLARLLEGVPFGRPYYAALAGALRGLILDGRLPARVRLPAERDLAAALAVSRTTVTAAYDRLRDEGFMVSRTGAGSWTSLPPSQVPHPGAPPAGRFPPGSSDDAHAIDLGRAVPTAPAVFDDAVTSAVAGMRAHTAGHGYAPAGLPDLRAVIAERYAVRGVPTDPEQIVVTSGAQQAVFQILQALVTPGDGVLIERPTYPHALEAIRRRGARLVPVGVNEGWDIELIATSLRQAAVRAAYVVPEFHNPTGHLMSGPERAALIEAACRADTYVISDETFVELSLDPASAQPEPLAAHDTGGRVVSVGSASKLFWGGLRIGWIRAPAPLARRLVISREPIDIASPVMEQLITYELMLRIEEVRAERATQLLRRRDALAAALRERLPGWRFTLPAGGMSLWPRMPEPLATPLAEAAARRGLRVVPGPVFGVDGVLEDRVRLPYVLPSAVLHRAVDRLAQSAAEATAMPVRRLPTSL